MAKKKNKKKSSTAPSSGFSYFARNALALGLIIIIWLALVKKNNGYKWAWENLIQYNLEIIDKYGDWDIHKKQAAKRGYYYQYLKFIKENTPEDAVIAMPADSVIKNVDKKYKLKNLVKVSYTHYFLYPRKVYYAKNEMHREKLKDKVTHIAIVNYQGYEKLPYDVPNKQQFTVMPLNPNTPSK